MIHLSKKISVELKELIVGNKFPEVFRTLEEWNESNGTPEIGRKILTYKARFLDIDREKSQGLITWDESSVNLNKFRNEVLELIDQLEDGEVFDCRKFNNYPNLRKEWFFRGTQKDTSNRQRDPVKYWQILEEIIKTFDKNYEEVQPIKDQNLIFNNLYNYSFCIRIQKSIVALIDPEQLSYRERLILMASGWLFYSGLILSDSQSTTKQRFDRFSTSIKDIIAKIDTQYPGIKKAIQDICEKSSWDKITEIKLKENEVRKRLIGACLLLVETFNESISIDQNERPPITIDLFTKIIPIKDHEKEEVYMHWLKRMVASVNEEYPEVKPSHTIPPDGQREIWNVTQFNTAIKTEKYETIRMEVEADLKSYFSRKLFFIRKTFRSYLRANNAIDERLRILKLVDPQKINIFSCYVLINPVESGSIPHLTSIRLISSIIKNKKASAGHLAKAIAEMLHFILTQEQASEEDNEVKTDAIIKSFKRNILDEIICKNRPGHIILQKISDCLEKLNPGNLSEISNALKEFYEEREFVEGKRPKLLHCIYENARPFLIHPNPILLFGYSSTILYVLQQLSLHGEEPEKKAILDKKLYIASAANKNRFNEHEELEYFDGGNYAKKLRDLGYTNVEIVPDIIIGSLMKKSGQEGVHNDRQIASVLLGTNGVSLFDKTFGNTAGQATIVDLATCNKVPLFIITDSWKITKAPFPKNKEERKTNWLPVALISELKANNISLFNPREDFLPLFPNGNDAQRILITDKGVFFSNHIPNKIVSNFLVKHL